MKRFAIALLAIAGCRSAAPPAAPVVSTDGAITMTVRPSPAYVEVTDGAQYVNCDLDIANASGVEWQLGMLQVEVFDTAGALVLRKFVDGNGVSPSIGTVPNRTLPPKSRTLVLNPLHAYPRDLELAKLRFTATYERKGAASRTVTAEVSPVVYEPRAALQLPLAGRVLVWDGHDFLSHHRRWDYLFDPIRDFGFTSNVGRYSYDFVIVDEQGAMSKGDESDNASWFVFGKPIRAPAAGTVVAAVDDRPDDRTMDMAALKTNLMAVYGNYVVIDHGHGEFSLLGHVQHRSAKVKVGAQVTAGQEIAAVGASGSSLFPHLHYQLQTTADGHAEGLPSYFTSFARVRGARRIDVARGAVESGEILDVR
jgi:hypothetical protein